MLFGLLFYCFERGKNSLPQHLAGAFDFKPREKLAG
jgi:hypothetical protein